MTTAHVQEMIDEVMRHMADQQQAAMQSANQMIGELGHMPKASLGPAVELVEIDGVWMLP
jgi:hypothetical protein